MVKAGGKVKAGLPGVGSAELSLEYDSGKDDTSTISPDTIFIGHRSDGDHCFINETVKATGYFFYHHREKTLQFPSDLSDVGKYEITCVMVRDEWKDGTGGTAEITSGGVGKDHVHIKLRSKFIKGFGFDVAVYGKRVR